MLSSQRKYGDRAFEKQTPNKQGVVSYATNVSLQDNAAANRHINSKFVFKQAAAY
jgi:hypothetical protein